MRPFGVVTSRAVPFGRDDVDTDLIIPSREIRGTGRTGLAAGLFANLRYLDVAARVPDPAFVLNRPEYAGAELLVAGANFGAGSSREHAVWALAEYGFRAVIAPSFSPIFANNAVRNGLLPVRLAEAAAVAAWDGAVTVDLPAEEVRAGGRAWRFAVDAEAKAMLLAGADALDLTLADAGVIAAWREVDRAARPWVYA